MVRRGRNGGERFTVDADFGVEATTEREQLRILLDDFGFALRYHLNFLDLDTIRP